MQAIYNIYDSLTAQLHKASDYLWPFLLRVILFYEFFFPGLGKLKGDNWFTGINDKFPFPFNHFSPDLNWFVAGYGEVIFSCLLLVGLFTRFAAISLVVITGVAVAAVHWPESWTSLSQLWGGYGLKSGEAGNYKLPLLYILMFMPLIFNGAGKLSLDKVLLKLSGRDQDHVNTEASFYTYALLFAVPAVALIWVMPKTGISLFIISGALALFQKIK